MEALPVRSCFIDGEAIVVDSGGLSAFLISLSLRSDRTRRRDLRKVPIEQRKDLLAKVMRPVRRSHPGITLNEHYEGDRATIYEHACRFGCEGIVPLAVPIGAHGSLAQDQES